jgi:inner membrane transporter RhtA
VLLSILSIQIGAALAKHLFTLLNPMSATLIRVGFAALLLLGICRPRLRNHSRRDYMLVALFGASIACMNLAFYESIARIPLGIAVSLEFTGPLAVAVLGSRRPLDLLWVALAVVGIILLAPLSGTLLNATGVALALLAGVCWAAFILLAGPTGRAFPGGSGLAVALTIAALLLLPFGVIQAGTTFLNPLALLIGVGVALLGTVIPYSLEFEALKSLPPRVFGVLVSIEPAVAALVGFILLGEQLEIRTLAAVMLMTSAAIGVTLFGRHERH